MTFLSDQTIPVVKKDGIKIRLVAGTVDGVTGPVTEIAAAPLYMDVQLTPDMDWTLPVTEEHTAVAYVFEGEAVFFG